MAPQQFIASGSEQLVTVARQLEIATAQRNALLQRDDALVTRWWSIKLKLPTLLALVEFYFGVGNASRSFFFTVLTRWLW